MAARLLATPASPLSPEMAVNFPQSQTSIDSLSLSLSFLFHLPFISLFNHRYSVFHLPQSSLASLLDA